MSTISQVMVSAFLSGNAKKMSNTKTDGRNLWLFDNKIAEHREDGLYISNAGWFSKTTKERLNYLPEVNISQRKKKWYLNGNEWDGNWIKVNDNFPPQIDNDKVGEMFDTSKRWVSSSAWRGYYEPEFAVAGANDTGMFSDSPCPTNVAMRELVAIADEIKKQKIKTKLITTESSNVFCIHHYIIVPPKYLKKAKEIAHEHYNKNETQLLYLV